MKSRYVKATAHAKGVDLVAGHGTATRRIFIHYRATAFTPEIRPHQGRAEPLPFNTGILPKGFTLVRKDGTPKGKWTRIV